MELPSKVLEQIAFNTRPKNDEHMLIVMDKSTHDEQFFQPLQRSNKQFKIAVTFVSAHNGIFNVTISNIKFYSKKALIDEVFIQITISPGAYAIESLHDEIKRVIIDEGHYTEAIYPFRIKPNFSKLGSIVEILPKRSIIGFVFDDNIGNFLRFNETILWQEYNLSPNPVDSLPFDNVFLGTDVAHGMIFRGNRAAIIHNFTMDVDPGYNSIEKFRGGIQWYMMETKDFISSVNLKLTNENGELVSFNGQSVAFRLSIKEV